MGKLHSPKSRERIFQGSPVSGGIAIGEAAYLEDLEEMGAVIRGIARDQIDDEISRYRSALCNSRNDLEHLYQTLSDEGAIDAGHIIATHIQMLSDPLITTHVEEMIRKMRQNTESVFCSVMSSFKERLGSAHEKLFQNRAVDVVDLSYRVLSHLRAKTITRHENLPHNAVIFAKELTPSETATFQAASVCAFVTEEGGGNSHAALIARSKGIPFVTEIDVQWFKEAMPSTIIVDGFTGSVILNPSPKTVEKYRLVQTADQRRSLKVQEGGAADSITMDGKQMPLYVNVGSVLDLEEGLAAGAAGVGLFRTEFLLSEEKEVFFSEEKQFQVYKKAALASCGHPLVMRVFDIGGDKFPEIVSETTQELLKSLRGIRFLLARPKMFKKQLRALFRAIPDDQLFLLLPLVEELSEIVRAKELIDEVAQELFSTRRASLGCLIETKAAAEKVDKLVAECDFLSLGTNDLCADILGMDRRKELCDVSMASAHPQVIAMIAHVVRCAKESQKSITVCGEIASNPLFVPLLLGFGVDALSAPPRFLPHVRRAVRASSLDRCQELARRVLECTSIDAVLSLLSTYL